MNFFIVSGLSGSGKSIALQALEDMNYYCIDNLPAVLLPRLASLFLDNENKLSSLNCAVGIDSRNRNFLDSLPEQLTEIEQLGLNYKILFLETDDSALVIRFSETRRRHPLTDKRTALLESIKRERVLLDPLASVASQRIDTTHRTPQELRGMVRDFAGGASSNSPILLLESFGYKYGTPLDADFVFDVRCLPNPYWNTSLRKLTGLDDDVVAFLSSHSQVNNMIEDIRGFIEKWLPDFQAENRSYITVAIGCTGGRHRSVYVSKQLMEHFSAIMPNIQLRHRELMEH